MSTAGAFQMADAYSPDLSLIDYQVGYLSEELFELTGGNHL
jgi:hypothetical protein